MRIRELFEGAKRLSAAGIDVSRVSKDDFLFVKKQLNPLLEKVKIKAGWTAGGAGTFDPEHDYGGGGREDSSDIDIMIDPKELVASFSPDLEEYNNSRSKPYGAKALANILADPARKGQLELQAAKWALATYLTNNGFRTNPGDLTLEISKQDKTFSVDLIVRPRSSWALHTHDFSRDPGMRGGDLWEKFYPVLAKIASKTTFVDPKSGEEKGNLQFSPDRGLVDRDTNQVVAINKDDIAKILLGPQAKGKDLASISGIKDQLMKNPEKWAKTKTLFSGDQQ